MAFTDWDFIQTSSVSASLTGTSPLNGASSLMMNGTASGFNRGQAAQVSAGSGITRGIGRGKIRTLIQKVSGADDANFTAGIFCLAEDANFGSGTGNAYFAIVETSTGNVSMRYGSNLAPGAATLLDSSNISFTNGSTIGLELEWDDDADNEIGGQHFMVRVGTQTDYSDLSEVINVVDPNTRTIAGYEGLCHMNDISGTPAVWYFDDTVIFTIS